MGARKENAPEIIKINKDIDKSVVSLLELFEGKISYSELIDLDEDTLNNMIEKKNELFKEKERRMDELNRKKTR